MKTPAKLDRALHERANRIFGARFDPMPTVERRAEEYLKDRDVIAWEVDATNFRFQYVSASAERVLGYPATEWVTDPAFWIQKVVHTEDVQDAVSALALATGKGIDHDFDFRAVSADGRVRPFRMIVRTMLGVRGIATHLRGLMIGLYPREARSTGTPGYNAISGAPASSPLAPRPPLDASSWSGSPPAILR